MSYNDEDRVRELEEERARLRASLTALADEMEGTSSRSLGYYADRVRELAGEGGED